MSGARPLKRALQKHVQDLLADAILAGKVLPGDTAVIDSSKDRFWVSTSSGKGAREREPAGA